MKFPIFNFQFQIIFNVSNIIIKNITFMSREFGGPSPEEMRIKQEEINTEQKEQHKIPKIEDIYKRADNAARYSTDLDIIKDAARNLSQELYELGVADLPSESELAQAYDSLHKIKNHYTDLELAKSAMEKITSLIYESEEFKNANKAER